MLTVFLVSAAVVFGLMFATWLFSLARRDASIVDIIWGFGFVLVAWAAFIVGDGSDARKWLITAMATIWGLRLSIYLFRRNWGHGEDFRYKRMRAHYGARFPLFSLFTVFGLQGVLIAQVVAAAVTLVVQVTMVGRLHLGMWRPDRHTAWNILRGGFSFLMLDIVLRLQPFVDATFLAQLAPAEALGWHGAASRIAGVLIFPALTLNFALYPTLARLWMSDRPTYDGLVRLGLRTVALVGVLAGTGTALFAPWAVSWIYGNESYAPAGVTLRVMSVFIVLVYVTIILGPAIAAAGRQWRWCAAQSLCLVVSALLDPVLIPWAHRVYGNGSLGVGIAIGVAEVAMVAFGLLILPPGILNRALGRTVLRCVLAAAGAALVALPLLSLPVVAMVATVVVYIGLLRVQGELDADLLLLAPAWLGNAVRPWRGKASS